MSLRSALGEAGGAARLACHAHKGWVTESFGRGPFSLLSRGLAASTSSPSGDAEEAKPGSKAEKSKGAAASTASQNVVTKDYLDQARWRIFGTHVGNGLRSGRKVLRKNLIGDKVVSWYPQTEAYGKPHAGDKLWDDPDLFM